MATITDLVEDANAVGTVVVVLAIDIPTGLPETGSRPADEATRAPEDQRVDPCTPGRTSKPYQAHSIQ